MLCAPSTKQIQPPPGPDHFQGYPATPAAGNDGPIVQIDDQFGSQTTDLGPPIRFLVPVDKNDEGLGDPISHLTCYQINEGDSGPAVISTNQFGAQPLTLGTPDSLCVPTEKLIAPGPVDLNHYKCYAASGAPLDIGVVLLDQFQARTALVLEPKLFCTPADKNGEGIDDPINHLTCYTTDPVGESPGLVPISNQFIAGDQLQLFGPDLLCAPSTKQVPPPAEHFTVYRALGPEGPAVTMADQFGTQTTDLGPVNFFMVPADKNDEGIFDSFTHLTCHEIVEPVPSQIPYVSATNQFATDQPLAVGLPRELCVPTEKLIAPGPIDGDHYRCWEASGPIGASLDIDVTLVDQFQGFGSTVVKPFRICNPVDKNGEGIEDSDTHLVCYIVAPEGGFLGLSIPIWNQFFNIAPGEIEVAQPFAVCAPSAKEVPEPSVLVGLASGVALLIAVDRRRRRKRERDD